MLAFFFGASSQEVIHCPEFIRFVPETILMDGISSARLEIKVAPGTQSVKLR